MKTTTAPDSELLPPLDENRAPTFSPGGTASPSPTADPHSHTTRLAYSVREAALLLGLSEKSVRRLISRGLLRASRALRHLLIPKKEIQRFLDETTNT